MTHYIYKLTSPSGNFYVGLTGQTVAARWKGHQKTCRAGKHFHLPLYRAMQKYGPDNFQVQTIQTTPDLPSAQAAERFWIAKLNPEYNNSEGGETFSKNCHKAAEQWRKDNPKEAWRTAYRASRMARTNLLKDPRFTDKGRLIIQSAKVARMRADLGKSKRVATEWATQDQTVRCQNISTTQKARMAAMTPEQRRKGTEKARAAIKHTPEVKAARKAGISKFWAELKADPVRYAAFIANKRAKAQAAALRQGKSLRST